MYLMNVSPVVASHTEWRTCGPLGGYSLPTGFDDSDQSARGTPISNKVQMIIESLRSTQSSLEMSDEIEGNVPPGQACKSAEGSFAGGQTKAGSPAVNQLVCAPVKNESTDSDSDDSVDRGIEEAIKEYLKEKDGHKRKVEASFFPSSKIPRLNSTTEMNNCSNEALSATTSQISKCLSAETPNARAYVPLKKYIKNKASIDDFPVDFDCSMKLPSGVIKKPPKATGLLKHDPSENEPSDSSSDDGIEEAIQRYQMEKIEQQSRGESCMPHEFTDESDSTSDDGIEEAIRSYQLQQLKKKSTTQPLLHTQKLGSRKKGKLKKKRNRPVKEFKSVLLPLDNPLSPMSSHQDGKGTRTHPCKEQPTTAPLKANTTAELMCAEAILDISKTVLSGAFHHSVEQRNNSLPESALPGSALPSRFPDNCPADESDGSSVDSEDGIEQEIMEFLERKAQLQQKPDSSSSGKEPHSVHETTKQDVNPKTCQRLSLTRKRRRKQENGCIASMSGSGNNPQAAPSKPLQEHKTESSALLFTQDSQGRNVAGLKAEKSGDKSSSLDSDEDLDTAIKDLLKTKKKSKKKVRDLKQKSRKGVKGDELSNASQINKLRHDATSKHGTLKKLTMGKNGMKLKSELSKNTFSETRLHKHAILKRTERTKTYNMTQKDDSSSVDSDDSIEQEIRRFLAQKAENGSATEGGKCAKVSSAMVAVPSHGKNIEENQLAEIPIRSKAASLSGSESNRPQITLTIPPSQRLLLGNSLLSIAGQSSPAQSDGVLEPADGAGAAKSEQSRQSPQSGQSTNETPKASTPCADRSQTIKWRQSFGLPVNDIGTLSRTPFHITSPNNVGGTVLTGPFHSRAAGSKPPPPSLAWSSVKTSRSPFGISTIKSPPIPRAAFFNLLSAPKERHSPSLTPDHKLQMTETESMVHIPKDKSVYVELESDRTNHVQVRSSEEGTAEVSLERELEKNVKKEELDEEEGFLDGDTDNSRKPVKEQGYSTLCLSSEIDPGLTVRPYIAFTSEERSSKTSWRHRIGKGNQLNSILQTPKQNRIPLHVRRRLKFIPVYRATDHL
ncbi:protein phosphatase 1 regulatory subunit 26 isoform X1 [Synchiropus splendidus]|uniref:protein phosphatase 1 regulatory subunit 26 isoform X1 n=1 Tax=Synchiropus splendidus TaxID=270530 RepID=UPI00237E1ACB|nr:protein phosphatase 1 regulatory subunit 26 isoform X1 [Synchiropus splendidus]